MKATKIERRDFLKAMGVGAAAIAMPRGLRAAAESAGGDSPRPNILWISAEDISPTLGCYGDPYATTPNLDRFAQGAIRYDRAFAAAPVCAPARSGIITGMYATAIGTQWMRCSGIPPVEAHCFPEYLRAAGYFCTNNSKTDYQFAAPLSAWDINGRDGHWRRRGDKAQPFFAVINLTVTHESSTRVWKAGQQEHDPDKAPLPPYYPDTPIVRQNIACYYDRMSQLDAQAQAILDALEADGLAEDTIVWFWGDHGWGLTRGKRWIYDSGVRVPLMVRVPPKYRKWAGCGDERAVAPGSVDGELASFIDFAPTVLSLAGVPIPPHMQGQAFLGPRKPAKPRQYIFAARDRMDETIDRMRCLRDKQFKYIRNFMPFLTRGQHIDYMDQTPILKEMRRLNAAGQLRGPQLQFFEPTKPVHELYDTQADPHEVNNLAADPKYKDVLDRMGRDLVQWMKDLGDVGLIPEADFDEMKQPPDGNTKAAEPVFTPADGAADGPVKVALSCATAGASITYRLSKPAKAAQPVAGKAVVLAGAAATIHGNGARKTGQAITNWRGKTTSVSWEVDIPAAGPVPIHVAQANAGGGGSEYEVSIGDAKARGVVRGTPGWDDYVYVAVGEVSVPKAGRYTVTVTPIKQVGGRLTNLRAVVLYGGKDLPKLNGDGGGGAAGASLLYSRPIALKPGERMTAQAWRLGFAPSAAATFEYGQKGSAPATVDTQPQWRERLRKSDLLDRLLALKSYDDKGPEVIEACLKALSDKDSPVRYWAVVGLHHGCKDAAAIAKAKAAIAPLLKDDSPSVPVAAAHALVDWGEGKEALDVLAGKLKAPGEKTRLLAATALCQLGEKARPALPALQAASSIQRYPGAWVKRAIAQLTAK